MLRIVAALIVLLALSTGSMAEQPNIVVIMTDDDSVAGLAHQSKIQSLMVDKGVSFTNAYAVTPTCCPDRSSFLTGLFTHNHGVMTNAAPDGGWPRFVANGHEQNSLPKWLQDAGYRTGLYGKYLNDYDQRGAKPPYWDSFQAFTGRQGYYDQDVNVNGANVARLGTSAADYSTDWIGGRAVEFVSQVSTDPRPYFLLFTPIGPHTVRPRPPYPIPAPRHANTSVAPFEPPPNFAPGTYSAAEAATLWERRLRTMLSVGDQVEAIVNAVTAAGKLDDTVFVYVSDNGFCIGENGKFTKALPWECSARIYMIVRGSGIPEGETRNQLVSMVDLPSTICVLAGCTPGVTQEGGSLLPIIADSGAPWRSSLLVERHQLWHAVRHGSLKYIRYGDGAEELYDLAVDPWEIANEANNPAFAAELADMQSRLDILKNCSGSSCWMQ